jgi:uncharacterized protein YcbK (DUF882 family)
MYRCLALATLLVFSTLASPAPTPAIKLPQAESRLRLLHLHTGERIDVVFRRGGEYVTGALDSLNHFLRDHRTGDVHQYDPRVFDLLADLTKSVDRAGAELQIICGYRTPASNQFLRDTSTGVAKNSLHMQAEAIDIRLPGVPLKKMREAALALGRGGVGYYAASNFIHVDVGRVRQW